jgi:antitoxin YefM
MTVTATEARRTLYGLIDKVNADRTPVRITSQRSGTVVVMPEEDWEAWQETAYLFASPANARRLQESFQNVAEGRFTEQQLDES